MIIGNTFAQNTLRTIIQSLDADTQNKPIFLLVTGPENIGKTAFIQELMQEALHMFYMQDFLFVQDMTSKIGKPHTLKVGKTGVESDIITFDDGSQYKDITMREIIARLQYSSAGAKKAILLENIERMNLSSANAFLKAAEEPLPGRIIIATTAHPAQIMETIVSRAIVVPFQALSDEQMQTYITRHGLEWETASLEKICIRMAMGRPGILTQFANMDSELTQAFVDAIQALQEGESIHAQYASLVKIHKAGYLHTFLDARIAQSATMDIAQTQRRLAIKKKLKTNVNIEKLILSGIIG